MQFIKVHFIFEIIFSNRDLAYKYFFTVYMLFFTREYKK